MSATELVQIIYKQQELDFQVFIVCQKLTIFNDRKLQAENKFTDFSECHI